MINLGGTTLLVIGLSTVVLVVLLATVHLYRRVSVLEGAIAPPSSWPFRALSVGQPLSLGDALPALYSGFVLIGKDSQDAFAAVVSSAVVARDWGYSVVVLAADTGAPSSWLAAAEEYALDVTTVGLGAIEALQPRVTPVVCFVRDGLVLDATGETLSPTVIASRFERVAGPLISSHS